MLEKNDFVGITKVKDFVNYHSNAIVSKTIIEKKSGTITIFAFDKDQGLSEHTAPYDALVQIIDGKAEITINKKKFYPKKGEMLIMPANHPHALKAIEPFKMLLTMIKA
jgi:quercetin dioxygenase-like cupin family protein